MCETANRNSSNKEVQHGTVPLHPVGKNGRTTLTVNVIGVAMLLPEERRAVLVDGRTSRVSRNFENEIIPAHYPVIGVEAGTYEARDVNDKIVSSDLSFNLDHNGHGKHRVDGFLLTGYEVAFRKIDTSCGFSLDDKEIASMRELPGNQDLQLAPGVADGTFHKVITSVDLSNACEVGGQRHGLLGDHKLVFGATPAPRAGMVTATFNRGLASPVILLKSRERKQTIEITLLGHGPWTVFVANVPADELFRVTAPINGALQLTHVELLYDLYKISPDHPRKIPFCPEQHALDHTVNGHCGPPVKP